MRVIEGQSTLQARTTHDIGIDSVKDEIVVPNPFAEAILIYRGGANGDEPPIRVIQGPKTMIGYTDNVAVDSVHGEIFAAQFRTDAVLVFSRDANGNVPPIRILRGPKTKLDRPFRVDVDPANNLLAVTTIQGLWIFNRTDNGDVAPRQIIAGPKTGIGGENSLIMKPLFYPQGRKIFVAGGTKYGAQGEDGLRGGRISIWKYEDNGDVAPWAVLPSTPVTEFRGTNGSMALDPENKELILVTAGQIYVYHLPEVFD
ncbi:MAG: hypothetical protein A3J28_10485 [Acidobacteria bacterium RIFCSPLOWO2_12_FULL_60_22]|nr:MAG: hypothetical protein A3J28_10485 [Acidobacteria bacterium RIFCSPLOWO2_12_FULL_60_22]